MAGQESSTRASFPQVVPGTGADTQRGSAAREFIEALWFVLVGFSLGLAVGAMVCIQFHKGAQP
jgi:hypothetical protein